MALRTPDDAPDHALFEAVCRQLSASPLELDRLRARIDASRIPTPQMPHVLKALWTQLERLRASRADITTCVAVCFELRRRIDDAFACLESGEGFAPEAADDRFAEAYRSSIAAFSRPECVASIRAVQASVAALALDYRRAVSLYADAAATPGLTTAQRWQYGLEQAAMLESLGRTDRDEAAYHAAIGLLERQVLCWAPRGERPADWAATQLRLAHVRLALAHHQRGTHLFNAAIEAAEAALTVIDRNRSPAQWASAQRTLGAAFAALGHRRADPEVLEKAEAALRRALAARGPTQAPEDWATSQQTLAGVLLALGQRTNDRQRLKQATEAYKAVVQVWTRETAPLDWAAAMDGLGSALRALGEHRNAPRTFEQAIAAYRSALAERTRTRAPALWALTQNNLGAAHLKLAERTRDPLALEAAIDAFDSALEVWTREDVPLTWAMALANRAAAGKLLAEIRSDIEWARYALSDFLAVAQAFRDASHAPYYELATEQIALTRKLVDALDDHRGRSPTPASRRETSHATRRA